MTELDPKFWRDRRVFVTGGTGLVGGWVEGRQPGETFSDFSRRLDDDELGALAGLIFLGEMLTLVQWAAIGSIVAASAGSSATRELMPN